MVINGYRFYGLKKVGKQQIDGASRQQLTHLLGNEVAI